MSDYGSRNRYQAVDGGEKKLVSNPHQYEGAYKEAKQANIRCRSADSDVATRYRFAVEAIKEYRRRRRIDPERQTDSQADPANQDRKNRPQGSSSQARMKQRHCGQKDEGSNGQTSRCRQWLMLAAH
jgi:hypothetical protein